MSNLAALKTAEPGPDAADEPLLAAVRDWPVATAAQLTRKCRLDQERAAEALGCLRAAGWVRVVAIAGRMGPASGAGDRQELYLLTDSGMASLAAAEGVPVRAYAARYGVWRQRHYRALMQAETTWWLYEMLGRLREQGYELDVRAHAPMTLPGGSRHWPLATGVAGWSSPGARGKEYRPVLIEWDTGDVLVAAYRSRFDLLYRSCRRLTETGQAGTEFPVTVMLTTTVRRAMQLLVLWGNCALEEGIPVQPFFVAPWQAVLSSPAVWRRPAAPLDAGRLFVGVRGVEKAALPAEMRLTYPTQGQKLAPARDLSLGVPPAPPSAGRAGRGAAPCSLDRLLPPSGPGAEPNRPPGRRQGDGAASVAEQLALSTPGRRLLERIAAWPLLSCEELAAVAGLPKSLVQENLDQLRALGLIATYTAPDGRDLAHLTPQAISFLAAVRGASPAWYAAGRQWPVERLPDSREVRLRLAALTTTYAHTCLTRWLFAAFLETARHFREERMLAHRLAVWEEFEARRHFHHHGRPRVLVPDAAGVYLIGDQAYDFLVESDTGTRHQKSLAQKFAVHRDYAASLAYRQDRVRLPLVLVVTARGDARVQELAAAAGSGMTYLIASRTDLEKHGLHRPVWLDAATGRRRHCFDGFREPPESARMRLDLRVKR
jgi:DNA-binding MarR family transcriptional regulator